jgi:hypothetical protein
MTNRFFSILFRRSAELAECSQMKVQSLRDAPRVLDRMGLPLLALLIVVAILVGSTLNTLSTKDLSNHENPKAIFAGDRARFL